MLTFSLRQAPFDLYCRVHWGHEPLRDQTLSFYTVMKWFMTAIKKLMQKQHQQHNLKCEALRLNRGIHFT